LRLPQDRGNVVIVSGKSPNAPIARSFGHVRIDKLLSAQIPQIAITAHQENPRNWLSFCETRQELMWRDRSH
jgi:hypothetical protein